MNTFIRANIKSSQQIWRALGFLVLALLFNSLEDAQNQSSVAAAFAKPSPQQTTALSLEMIVFNSNRTGNDEIYLMNADGSDQRALTNDKRFDSWWGRISPDRRQILFYRTPKGVHDDDYSQNSLWVMNADGLAQRELRPAGTDGWIIQGHAEWSPDGKSLVMFGGKGWKSAQIYVTTNAGQEPRRLTNGKGSFIDPSWSPDGKTIVFTGCLPENCSQKELEVYTIAVSGSGPAKRLTNDSIPDYDPYYSPDGKMIGWLSRTADSGSEGVWGMRLAAADGSEMRYVINDGNVNGKPEWSRNGKLIYFHRLIYGKSPYYSIWVISPNGQGLKKLTAGLGGHDEYPSS
jgi:TolB protein